MNRCNIVDKPRLYHLEMRFLLYHFLQRGVTHVEEWRKDAWGETSVKRKGRFGRVKVGVEFEGKKFYASATDKDIMKASALAYLNVVNNIIVNKLM